MNDLQLNKILSITIIILASIIIYCYIHNKYENLNTSNEAIQNIGSIFTDISGTVSINRFGVKGNVNFKQLKGIIVAWSGPVSDIPDGWGFCDGSTYTAFDGTKLQSPDLRSKFILGSSKKYILDAQGGEETHVLTEKEIPPHTHTTMSETIFGCPDPYSSNYNPNFGGYLGGNCVDSANYNQTTSSATGKNLAHNNMPPYYTLAFIMKL
jgi:hypothetical protein